MHDVHCNLGQVRNAHWGSWEQTKRLRHVKSQMSPGCWVSYGTRPKPLHVPDIVAKSRTGSASALLADEHDRYPQLMQAAS